MVTTDLTQKGFMAYMADAIIAYIRAGHLPTEEAADYMNRFPLIDEFRRARITEEDLPWLIEVVRRESRMVGAYCLSLLRKYDERDDVKTFLRSRWETADAFFRAQLIWRLLDDPDLPQEWHRKLFNFVLAEWEAFRDSQVRFMGPHDALTNCLIRISDPDFTASKKWAYLCAAAAAGKRAGAMALVKTIHDEPWRYLDSKDQFVFTFMREVTEALLKLLGQEAG